MTAIEALNVALAALSLVALFLAPTVIWLQLVHMRQDRFVTITANLFEVRQRSEFLEAQLWVLHRLSTRSWSEFVAQHRADFGEKAFYQVGAYFEYVGLLLAHGMLRDQVTLRTIGGDAIAVWQKIEPLVREARRLENPMLFYHFEQMLPECEQAYLPEAGPVLAAVRSAPRMRPAELKALLDTHDPVTILDVRRAMTFREDRYRIPGAVHLEPDAILQGTPPGLPAASNQPVVAYCA